MNSKRLFYLLTGGVVVLALCLVGAAYELDSMFQQRSATLGTEQNTIAVLDGQTDALTRAKADIKKYQSLAQIAKSIVPQDKDQAQTVGEITKLASEHGITLSSISFPTSSLGQAGATSQPALSQLTPVTGINGVYSLEIVIQADASKNAVPYDNFTNFLKALEHNRRTALVTAVTITPDPKAPAYVGFSLTLQEYIKP